MPCGRLRFFSESGNDGEPVTPVKLVQFSESDHRSYCQLAARLQNGLTHSSAS
jgi:hypothetical protein